MSQYVRWFDSLGIGDVGTVGGKNASLGEMYRELKPLGVRQANGFAVVADAYREALDRAAAWDELHSLLDGLDKTDVRALERAGRRAREIVYAAGLPDAARLDILKAYRELQAEYGEDVSVAVRSSATAEDLPTASFAGQHDTYLNVRGEEMLLDAVRRCNASLFTDRAISYRIDHGFDHFKLGLSACVMKMVRSDLASSGVVFTVDTETGFPDVVLITAAWGLGETVVQGLVDVDEFYVHKPTFRDGKRAVLRRILGAKKLRMEFSGGRTREPVVTRPTPMSDRERFCLSDKEVLTLAGHALLIEEHYSRRNGRPTPMDIEWAKDGIDGEIYIVQARPETVASRRKLGLIERYRVDDRGAVALLTGRAVGAKAAAGPVRLVAGREDLSSFRPGEVLVADTTTPDWEPVMKTAGAIVTDRGGRTCHAAIVARELGIPAIVGVGSALVTLKTGQTVTVSCASGEVGRVYDGALPFDVETIDSSAIEKPRTRIMVNLGNPDLAFQTAMLPVDGVGLARMEFIVSEQIKAHPMALAHPDRVEDPADLARLQDLARHHPDGAAFFVERLSEGIGTIAAAFWPRPVILRLSDFKSNEYASLIGGAAFEPKEENPMIGFRGASRYAHPAYRDGFALECRAIARVRGEMGLTNLKVMVPFCRTLGEADAVIAELARNGLRRGQDGIEIWVMCEIPSNVILIGEFAERFDGFSIGSNDLTQLVLGVDRDSSTVASVFDERDPGVVRFLTMAIDGAHAAGRPIGICGQAPSDYPEMARLLVAHGIDSLSLTPDRVIETLSIVREAEAGIAGKITS